MDAKGVRLRGARISGRLDLEAATLRCPLQLDNCYAPEPVIFTYATVSLLALTGCHLAGLTGDTLTVTKDLTLSGSAFTGPFRLVSADIGGHLSCHGTQFTGADGDGYVLNAEAMKVGGGVFLDGEFTAAGAVRLAGADITGELFCRGAQLTGADGDALVAYGMKVGSDVFLDGGFTAAGGGPAGRRRHHWLARLPRRPAHRRCR